MSDLADLAKPFTGKYVKTKPGPSKAAYVEHSDVTQRLLQVVGGFDQQIMQVVRGDVPGFVKTDKRSGEKKTVEPLVDVVTGCVLSLTVEVDGKRRTIEEVGEVEHPHNHSTDASRLKFAVSDAFKRCAMRLGLGLHLWCQDHYFLDRALETVGGES